MAAAKGGKAKGGKMVATKGNKALNTTKTAKGGKMAKSSKGSTSY